jgi:hypothetical protein
MHHLSRKPTGEIDMIPSIDVRAEKDEKRAGQNA